MTTGLVLSIESTQSLTAEKSGGEHSQMHNSHPPVTGDHVRPCLTWLHFELVLSLCATESAFLRLKRKKEKKKKKKKRKRKKKKRKKSHRHAKSLMEVCLMCWVSYVLDHTTMHGRLKAQAARLHTVSKKLTIARATLNFSCIRNELSSWGMRFSA